MRVSLIKRKTVLDFATANAGGRIPFEHWLTLINMADWGVPSDIKKTFRSADILGKSSNRVVFDIGGNNYRIICTYHFGATTVYLYVKWIGTHAAYTSICQRNEQYSINNY